MLIKKLEIELTSACNAACPLCKRTSILEKGLPLAISSYSIDDIEDMFNDVELTGAKIKMCGVLGDPIACKDLLLITEYFLLEKGVGNIEVSTNAGLKTKKFWNAYGELSALSDGRLELHFAVDGVTRNDYRVGVNLEKVWQNIDTYLEAGGHAIWQYIIFDYNEHELDDARRIAKEKGMIFATRTAWKNTTKKDEYKKVIKQSVERTYDIGNISCQHLNDQEIYIASDRTVWPCCYLFDEYVAAQSDVKKAGDMNKLNDAFGSNFNSLDHYTLNEIINNEWFDKLIEESLEKNHSLNLARCWKSCGDHGKRRTQKNVES